MPASRHILLDMDRLWTPWRYAYVTGAQTGMTRPGVPESLSAWPGDEHCLFCNMLAAVDYAIAHGMPRAEAEAAALILERGKTCFLVLNAFPYNNGHLMVVPYEHQASLAALRDETATEMMQQTRRAERVLRAVYHPDGLNMGLNLGDSAGAGVADHLHLHAVPRWSADTNFMSVLGETRVLPEMLTESWRRLRAALATDPVEETD
jgi:ATP adenylyltransferase